MALALAGPADELAQSLTVMVQLEDQVQSMAEHRAAIEPLCKQGQELACHLDRWATYGPASRSELAEVARELCESNDDPVSCLAWSWRLAESGQAPKAARMVHKACLAGLGRACSAQAELRWKGIQIEKDAERALVQATKACEGGDAHGCHLVGLWSDDPAASAKALELGDASAAEHYVMSLSEEKREAARTKACAKGSVASCQALEGRDAAVRACHMSPPDVAITGLGPTSAQAPFERTSEACARLVTLGGTPPGRLVKEVPTRWWTEPGGIVSLWHDEDWPAHVVIEADQLQSATYRVVGHRPKDTTLELTTKEGEKLRLPASSCAGLREVTSITNRLPAVPWVLDADDAPASQDCLESFSDGITFGAALSMSPIGDPAAPTVVASLQQRLTSMVSCREEMGLEPVAPLSVTFKPKKGTLQVVESSPVPAGLQSCFDAWIEGADAGELKEKLTVKLRLW